MPRTYQPLSTLARDPINAGWLSLGMLLTQGFGAADTDTAGQDPRPARVRPSLRQLLRQLSGRGRLAGLTARDLKDIGVKPAEVRRLSFAPSSADVVTRLSIRAGGFGPG